MDEQVLRSLKVGQLAESRCFQSGFRGAWFRCKIKQISRRKGQIELALEYVDFPDEKIHWTKIYQVPPRSRMSKGKKRQLMVRPSYPPICHESQMPHVNAISEVTVVVNGVWKVGDLVDWWTNDCHWSGSVTQILGSNKVQIELPPPPIGEGSCDEVSCKDLRPSLDWSPEHGWSFPTSKEGENSRRCARLIQPVNQVAEGLPNFKINAEDDGTKDVQATDVSPLDASISSRISSNSILATYSEGATEMPEANTELDVGDNALGKTSGSDSVSSSHVRDTSVETAGHPADEGRYLSSGPLKKMRTGGNIPLNSMYSDTLEAAVMDLEELVNRVKWLKGILEFGCPLSNAGRPPWKFMEHRVSSTPK